MSKYEYASLFFDRKIGEECWKLENSKGIEIVGYPWGRVEILNRLAEDGWRVIHVDNSSSMLLEKTIK